MSRRDTEGQEVGGDGGGKIHDLALKRAFRNTIRTLTYLPASTSDWPTTDGLLGWVNPLSPECTFWGAGGALGGLFRHHRVRGGGGLVSGTGWDDWASGHGGHLHGGQTTKSQSAV